MTCQFRGVLLRLFMSKGNAFMFRANLTPKAMRTTHSVVEAAYGTRPSLTQSLIADSIETLAWCMCTVAL